MIPWDELIARAEQVCCPRSLSSSSEAGAVAAAILTDRGNCCAVNIETKIKNRPLWSVFYFALYP